MDDHDIDWYIDKMDSIVNKKMKLYGNLQVKIKKIK